MIDKDKSIVDLLDALLLGDKGWLVKDYWEADLCAIGIASKSQPDRLVYVSTFNLPPGQYDCECEVQKNDSDQPYEVIDSAENIDLAALEKKMIEHLGTAAGTRRKKPSAKV